MTALDPITSVSVVSTGSVRIRPDHVRATWRPLYWWLLTSRTWTPPRPINGYVVEHRDGLVLFDTGQDRASVTDADYFPHGAAGVVYDRLAEFEIDASETLPALLDALGHDAADVRTAVISHLHQDHMGGIRDLPNAQLLVTDDEWRTVMRPLAEPRGFLREHIDLPGLRWRKIEFEPTDDPDLAPFPASHDLFGDGSLTLLPTPGHTSGSMSMLVRRASGPPLLMVGDLTYDAHLMEEGHVPGLGSRRRVRSPRARRSTRLRSGGQGWLCSLHTIPARRAGWRWRIGSTLAPRDPDRQGASAHQPIEVLDGDRQRGVPLAAERRRHLVAEVDADPAVGVRSEGEAVVLHRAPGAGGRPPAIATGDVRAGDVRERGLELHDAERRPQRAVVGERDAVLRSTHAEDAPEGDEPVVERVAVPRAHG